MVSVSFGAISVLAVAFLTLALPVLVLWVVFKLVQLAAWIVTGVFRTIGRFSSHLGAFARGTVVDSLHFAGGVLTAGVILPLALLNIVIGRWSSAAHYGRALEDELMSAAVSLYRVGLGHPIRLLGLGVLTEGLERRLPELVAHAPRESKRRSKDGFEGYKVVGNLPAGGSGARLFLAKPSADKVDSFRNKGFPDPGKVVIKSFALGEGSTLPQIVRESRALEAAGRLGLVLEHDLSSRRFHYVMPFVPGEDLDVVTHNMHQSAAAEGLSDRELLRVTGFASDLLGTLDRFHRGGLWHKDIKPSNLIVSNERIHLVDLGLVTPLESAMTLTTHGTEYFRDPELVRLALKGVKVHEVDGVKFDLYSAGAVLYSMVEGSFPAHGSLSRITKRCPDALQWIVRRAMAEMGSRYTSAAEMLADLSTVMDRRDPFAVRPADLPSVQGRSPEDVLREDGSESSGYGLAGLGAAAAAAPDQGAPAGETRSKRWGKSRRGAFSTKTAGVTSEAGVRRRGRRHTLAAAAFAAFFAFVVAAAADRDPRGPIAERGHRVSHFVERLGDRARSVLAQGDSPRAWRPGHAEAPRETFESRWNRWLGQELPARAGLERSRREASVLIVNDLARSADPEILSGLKDSLEARGYRVAGLLDDEMSEEGQHQAITWVAGARRAIGLSAADDPDAVVRLESFIASADRGLRAVLWVSQDPDQDPDQDGGEHVLAHLVQRNAGVSFGAPPVVDRQHVFYGGSGR